MEKKIFLCFAIIAVVGISAWAFILGGAGKNHQGDAEEGDSIDAAASAECNWGLSFQQEGAAPVGNATAEYLKQYNGYYIDTRASSKEKIFILPLMQAMKMDIRKKSSMCLKKKKYRQHSFW